MNNFVTSIALGFTIVASLGFGIGLGYFTIVGILNALSRNRAIQKPATAALASTASGSAGH